MCARSGMCVPKARPCRWIMAPQSRPWHTFPQVVSLWHVSMLSRRTYETDNVGKGNSCRCRLAADAIICCAGTIAVTAGGTSLCIWDMLAGGRLLSRLSNHQKTVGVTCAL
jgi:hypothetical protein